METGTTCKHNRCLFCVRKTGLYSDDLYEEIVASGRFCGCGFFKRSKLRFIPKTVRDNCCEECGLRMLLSCSVAMRTLGARDIRAVMIGMNFFFSMSLLIGKPTRCRYWLMFNESRTKAISSIGMRHLLLSKKRSIVGLGGHQIDWDLVFDGLIRSFETILKNHIKGKK